jgi:hypothetical protein
MHMALTEGVSTQRSGQALGTRMISRGRDTSDGLAELRALVEMLNQRGIRVELAADLRDEAEYHAPRRRMLVAADLTPSQLRRLRSQVAGRLLSGRW